MTSASRFFSSFHTRWGSRKFGEVAGWYDWWWWKWPERLWPLPTSAVSNKTRLFFIRIVKIFRSDASKTHKPQLTALGDVFSGISHFSLYPIFISCKHPLSPFTVRPLTRSVAISLDTESKRLIITLWGQFRLAREMSCFWPQNAQQSSKSRPRCAFCT